MVARAAMFSGLSSGHAVTRDAPASSQCMAAREFIVYRGQSAVILELPLLIPALSRISKDAMFVASQRRQPSLKIRCMALVHVATELPRVMTGSAIRILSLLPILASSASRLRSSEAKVDGVRARTISSIVSKSFFSKALIRNGLSVLSDSDNPQSRESALRREDVRFDKLEVDSEMLYSMRL